jgi:hypothetical protein
VDAQSINTDQIYDSTGRYLGTLTGSGDAQVLIDAINDRASGSGIVLPDPGFDLDWGQEVDLPANERGFTIDTIGRPTLAIPSGFTGSQAIHKPSSTSTNDQLQLYHIGRLEIDDSATESLSWGLKLEDIKNSVVMNPWINRAPGILVSSPNKTSTANKLIGPQVFSPRGPAVELDSINGPSNLNHVVRPFFNDGGNNTEIAYIDRANFNRWTDTHCEFASVVHLFDGAQGYAVSEGDWDRVSEYTNTVRESNMPVSGGGRIKLTPTVGGRFQLLRLTQPGTTVEVGGSRGNETRGGGVIDYHDLLRKSTPAQSLSAVGFNQASGTVNLTGIVARKLSISTGSNTNDTAEVNQGGSTFAPDRYTPKWVSWVTTPSTNARVRAGFVENSNNRIELVYDTSVDGNWHFVVELGGTVEHDIDTGIAGGGSQHIGINYEKGNSRTHSAVIDGSVVATASASTFLGPSQWHVHVETLEAASKTADVDTERGTRLYSV